VIDFLTCTVSGLHPVYSHVGPMGLYYVLRIQLRNYKRNKKFLGIRAFATKAVRISAGNLRGGLVEVPSGNFLRKFDAMPF